MLTMNFGAESLQLTFSFLLVQPHGFFNCSPAIDVPPNPCQLEAKDSDTKDNGQAKPSPSGLIAKL